MPAGIHNFQFYINENFTRNITWYTGDPRTPVDLSGYTAVLTVLSKRAPYNTYFVMTSVAAPLSSPDTNTFYESITLNASPGLIELALTPEQTATLTKGNYQYNLELYVGTTILKYILKGDFIIESIV